MVFLSPIISYFISFKIKIFNKTFDEPSDLTKILNFPVSLFFKILNSPTPTFSYDFKSLLNFRILDLFVIIVSSFSSPVLTSTFLVRLTTAKLPLTVSFSNSLDSSWSSFSVTASSVAGLVSFVASVILDDADGAVKVNGLEVPPLVLIVEESPKLKGLEVEDVEFPTLKTEGAFDDSFVDVADLVKLNAFVDEAEFTPKFKTGGVELVNENGVVVVDGAGGLNENLGLGLAVDGSVVVVELDAKLKVGLLLVAGGADPNENDGFDSSGLLNEKLVFAFSSGFADVVEMEEKEGVGCSDFV